MPSLRSVLSILVITVAAMCVAASGASAAATPVQSWETVSNTNGGSGEDDLLADPNAQQPTTTFGPITDTSHLTVPISASQTKQTWEGMGATLTDAAATTIFMAPNRNQIMQTLFGTGAGDAGLNVLRVPFGATDLSASAYTYDDGGVPDLSLTAFNLDPAGSDSPDVIALLQQALTIDPGLIVIGVPFSAPAWMKTDDALTGETCTNSGDVTATNTTNNALSPTYYGAYAQYLVDTLNAFTADGINFAAVSLVNEPENCNSGFPTMTILPYQQGIVATDLRAALNTSGYGGVQIIGGEMNWVQPWIPSSTTCSGLWLGPFCIGSERTTPTTYWDTAIMQSAGAGAINDMAYHAYDGTTTNLNPYPSSGALSPTTHDTPWYEQSVLHSAYPKALILDTESSQERPGTLDASAPDYAFQWAVVNNIIGPATNDASASTFATLATNQSCGPNISNSNCAVTLDGCGTCQGLVAIDSSQDTGGSYATYDDSQFTAAEMVDEVAEPGALEIPTLPVTGSSSQGSSGLLTLGFKNPDGSYGLLAYNTTGSTATFNINWDGEQAHESVQRYSVASYKW
jgi:glucosylceramidase